ncbi:MAG: EthD family reductase [Myxococcales bacterium]|nr:EthD family reductase [Myxococcales bacterium]
MFQILAVLKRRDGLSPEAFQEHWRGRHAELACKIPGLRRYVQNHTLLSGYRARSPIYDGVAELCFDDAEDFERAGASSEMAAAQADQAELLAPEGVRILRVEPHTIVDGPAPADGVKLISFLTRRHDLSRERFSSHWHDRHGPIAAGIPGMRRYLQYHARDDARFGAPLYDGIPIAWFEDTDALRASEPSEAYARTRADEAHFLEPDRIRFVIATEQLLLA